VKLLNDIDFRPFLSGRVIVLLVGMLMLGACASVQPEKVTPPPLQLPGPDVQIDDVDVLAVSPAMEKFLERYVLKYSRERTRLDMLTTAVSRSGALGFEYDDSHTTTSSEAFDRRMGNCVGFSNLMVALARRAGLDASYQEVVIGSEWADYADDTVLLFKHVNVVIETRDMTWVVDVSDVDIRPSDRRKLIDDSYAKALYLNNIAVEALLENDLPRAYAYMRSAIETDAMVSDAWVNLGVLFGRNDQLDDAAFAFNRALQIDSNEYSALSNLYEVYVEQGNLESAADLEPRVEKYRRNNPYYLLRLSDEALEQEQYRESISLLRKAIKKKEDDHKLHFALAKTQYLSGELVEAESSFLRARSLAPESMVVFYGRPLDELVTEK
jgi:tetratricopeptide (TPR) repeat protein